MLRSFNQLLLVWIDEWNKTREITLVNKHTHTDVSVREQKENRQRKEKQYEEIITRIEIGEGIAAARNHIRKENQIERTGRFVCE